jgi:hypothetical protein
MKTPSEKEIANWKIQRAKGKWVFVLKFTIFCSLASFTGFTIFNYFYDRTLTLRWTFLIVIFIFNFAGAIYLWKITERKFANYINEEDIANNS